MSSSSPQSMFSFGVPRTVEPSRTNKDLDGLPMYYDAGTKYPCTVMERKIHQMVCYIRSKPEWQRKANDDEICAKWTTEMVQGNEMNGSSAKYVIDAIKYLATKPPNAAVNVLSDGIYECCGLIEPSLRDSFIRESAKLENVPDEEKDWHPNSDDLVLDLVHPSLFCIVEGVTRKTTDGPKPFNEWIGSGDIVNSEHISEETFQWIPTDIVVSPSKEVELCSYINNLHPKEHAGLYQLIPSILTRFIPLFEHVIYDLKNPSGRLLDAYCTEWYNNEPSESDYESGGEYDEAIDNWYENRFPVQPEAPEFKPRENLGIDLSGRKLQVIVKMANIELCPEKPKYNGGSWHVEGTRSERIIATGIYYYRSENITESRLSFREEVDEPEYEQSDHSGIAAIYGLSDEELLIQPIGDIVAEEGKCIAFPNIYQHKVQPFELLDATKKGSRKILAFFLVDPNEPVLSTSDIPPQQKSWMLKELDMDIGLQVPTELAAQIIEFGDWPMTMQQAKQFRTTLMSQRTVNWDDADEYDEERVFSLCEH